jgi:regulator of replication initiation timing
MSVTNDHFYAEIERLEKQITKLKAERDVLQGVVTSYAMTERELEAERDRLKAALEEIASTGTLTIEWAKAIARRALAHWETRK